MIQAVITDIEGTTTPVSFVADTLFPYARKALPGFIRANRTLSEVAGPLLAARQLAGDKEMSDEAVIDVLLGWIDEDRKATPLKTLQGLVWAEGYAEGAFQGALYDDVPPVLQSWRQAGLRLFCYSSGSAEAQRLLFRHSAHGDLTPLFEGFFDTRIGAKLDPAAYTQIVRAVALAPERILFLSDHPGELDAAAAVGLVTARLERQRGVAMPAGRHPVHADFRTITLR